MGSDPNQPFYAGDHRGSGRCIQPPRIWRRRHHGGDAFFLVLGTSAELVRLQQYLGAASLFPSFDRRATSALFQFGAFSWLLAVSSVIFTQADRLLLGVSLGATTVTAYALCVQMAQPIYGIASSGLDFLFLILRRGMQSLDRQPSGKPS